MRAGAILSACALVLAISCTVDELVGSNAVADGGSDGGKPDGGKPDGGPFDAGNPICPGTGLDCNPVCGDQLCHSGCTGVHDCVITCSGTSCSFQCERPEGMSCSPSCEPGPCTMSCVPTGVEQVQCTMNCSPLQTCAADCHGGTCTVACGQLVPATVCDAGVYSCSESCPP